MTLDSGSAPPLEGRVCSELRAVLGEEGLLTDPGDLLAYESDVLTAYRCVPRAVLLPQSTAEISAAFRILDRADIPFVPRGAGTGLSGGALALRGSVVLSLARMNRILAIDPLERRARVQPGVVNAVLSAAVAPFGLTYAPDPSSQYACTLGGNVAENASGPHCLKYGATVNHVTRLTIVLAGGELVELGSGMSEPVGYDLVGLFIGSEGTFGVATEIELKLVPLPESVETLLALFNQIEDAAQAVSAIIAAGLLPAALELVDGEGVRAMANSPHGQGYTAADGAALIVEFDGPPEGLARTADLAKAVCERHQARRVIRASDEESRSKLWHARKKTYGVWGKMARDLFIQDAVVPRSKVAEVIASVYEIARRFQVRTLTAAHAGDGNIHPTLLFDRRDPDQLRRVEAASKEMMQVCIDAGGTLTGEHGVGLDKREYMPLMFGEAELSAMAAIRDVFDPRGLANPAKVLPLRNCREWKQRT